MKTTRVMSTALALWFLMSASAGATIVTSHLEADGDLNAMLPEDSRAFVAEGRIGDMGAIEDFEVDLGQSHLVPENIEQHPWQSGISEEFSLHYDKIWNMVRFVLGGDTLSYSPDLLFMEIFIRVEAMNANTTVTVDNLSVNEEDVLDSCGAVGAGGLDILRIQAGNLLDGFTLAGEILLIWSGSPPTGSELAFQIMVGNPDPQVATEKKTWGWVKSHFRGEVK
jgi:hypothetical protein